VKTKTTNYLGGYTDVESKIDFSGKTLVTTTRHKRTNMDTEIRTDEVFTYSNQDRLLTHTHQINGGEIQLLAANTYNEMGQLISKNVGGTAVDGSSGLQKVDYTYNIRGWLTGINDTKDLQDSGAVQPDLFAFKINYNTLDNNQADVKKLYNGNFAETRWRTDFDNLTRSYGYSYDELNRLTNAQYVRPSNPENPNPADIIDTFNEKLSYDKNGNIQSLVRNGGMESQTTVPVMDNLVYNYDADDKNKLIKVTDATANTDGFNDYADTTLEYGYDANGNMNRDDNKKIVSIAYNHLNLPTKIVIQRWADLPNISYLYTATGKKIAKTVDYNSRLNVVNTVDYLDGYQYENGKLLFFPTAEGYVKYTVGASKPFDYVFNYTDHLGNVRMSYGINPTTGLVTKLEENNYYPFGLKHQYYNSTTSQPNYKYKFQNKEWQDELSLNLYDFGGRLYDPASVRTTTHDPLAEKFYDLSPQSFLNNNPLSFIDPTGSEAEKVKPPDDYIIKRNGTIEVTKTNDKFDRFSIENKDGTTSKVAQLDKNEFGLVKFPESGNGFNSYGSVEKGGFSSGSKNGVSFSENVGSGDNYLIPETAACLFGVINELKGKGLSISLGDMSSSNGSDPADAGVGTFHHGGHGHLGKRSGLDVDFRYLGKDGNSFQGDMDNSIFSINNNKSIYEAAFRFGFDPKNTYQGSRGSIPGVKTMGGHNNHGHLGLKRN
jgi:RHS repeat-associated protein